MLFFFVRISLLEDFRRLLFAYLCSFALSVLTCDTAWITIFSLMLPLFSLMCVFLVAQVFRP